MQNKNNSNSDEPENITVYLRVRPTNKNELLLEKVISFDPEVKFKS